MITGQLPTPDCYHSRFSEQEVTSSSSARGIRSRELAPLGNTTHNHSVSSYPVRLKNYLKVTKKPSIQQLPLGPLIMSLAPIAPAPPPPPPPPPPPTGGSSNDKTIDTTPVVSKKDKKEKRERQTTETKSLHLGKGQAKQARVEGKGKGKERDVNRVSGGTGGVGLSSLEEDRMAAGRSRIQSAGGEWKFQAGGSEFEYDIL